MIKYSNGKNKSFNQMALEFKNILFKYIQKRLNRILKTNLPKEQKLFFRWLKNQNYQIVQNLMLSDPHQLQNIINFIEQKITQGIIPIMSTGVNNNLQSTVFGEKILSIFNYYYLRKYFIRWISEEINIPVCPYCNRLFTTSIKTRENNGNIVTKTLFTLDHFYSQVKYPYLSLSFYNLIPSCHGCNSILKITQDFTINSHIHPYVDNFNDYLKFSYYIKKADYLDRNDNQFNILLIPKRANLSLGDDTLTRANQSAEDLCIKEIYNTNKDYVFEILQKAKIFTPKYLNFLYQEFFSKFGISKLEMMRLLLSNYLTDEEIYKRPLAKLTKDISEELGLI